MVILGWGPERYIDDDSSINPAVAKHLRELLPALFQGKYERGNEAEMEWVRCNLSFLHLDLALIHHCSVKTGITGVTAMKDPFVRQFHRISRQIHIASELSGWTHT